MNKVERAALREMFGGRCAYCGCTLGDKWHADHDQSVGRHAPTKVLACPTAHID